MSMTKDEAKKTKDEAKKTKDEAKKTKDEAKKTKDEAKNQIRLLMCDCAARTSAQFSDKVEQLQAKVSEMYAIIDQLSLRWIPVTERLPEDGTPVLAYCTLHKQRTLTYESVVETWFQHGVSVSEPTHWMPLPTAPEKKEKI